MELMFEVISRHKFTLGPSASHVFGKVGGVIGRGRECEWVLPDKSQKVSRKHALISCDGTNFYIEDLSTNGIFAVLGKERLKKGERYKLEHGSSFLLGDYTVQSRLLQKPDAYIAQDISGADELIPDDAFLDLDPITAMDQQEEHEAKRRLGLYNDLLGTSDLEPVYAGHANEPRLDAMPSINSIPENWGDLPSMDAVPEVPASAPEPVQKPAQPEPPVQHVAPAPVVTEGSAEEMTEMEMFFRLLGFDGCPANPKEREAVLRNTAALVNASVDGMIQALQNRAESKNELRLNVTTMRLAGNNPLKFSPTAQAALAYLLTSRHSGMLTSGEAMLAAFEDLHSHHLGLLAGARAAVRAALEKIGPRQVEARLDAMNPTKFGRAAKLWSTFEQMHQNFLDDRDAIPALFLQDFVRAYEAQARTLNPLPSRTKGDL